jgi:hypothetical protein
MTTEIVSKVTKDSEGMRSELENCNNIKLFQPDHLYFITMKPNYRSYINRSIGESNFMLGVYDNFMAHFQRDFGMIFHGVEYDSKNVCHIHMICEPFPQGTSFLDSTNLSKVVNFKKGVYIDFRIVSNKDRYKLLAYVCKIAKTDIIRQYYHTNYGFI